jgi:hypothetical protein
MRGAAVCAVLWLVALAALAPERTAAQPIAPTTKAPTNKPTAPTTKSPTSKPTAPTTPTNAPTNKPTNKPTAPTRAPTTPKPTKQPTPPTVKPTRPPINPNNEPVCQQILGEWWSDRASVEAAATPGKCKLFDGDRRACVKQTRQARKEYIQSGKLTLVEALSLKCQLISGDKCVLNFCNPTPTSQCTLALTAGYCIYNTAEAAEEFDLGVGCRINPCAGSGLTLDDNSCQDRGIPGYFECTYCSALRDPALKGKGMGCQGVNLNFPLTQAPTDAPTKAPTAKPTTKEPTAKPTTGAPTTRAPTGKPTTKPTLAGR